ncbi:MAG: L,D-transpeptidase [Candidatus Fermentibacteraceae bacterium]|nr:L,D-transpeptidase [Candidatus Fermentibacteraceae bacterium]
MITGWRFTLNCFIVPFLLLRGIVSVLPAQILFVETEPAARHAIVSREIQTIVFLDSGREANLALVSTGRPSRYATPSGDFEILYKRWSPVSSIYRVHMPYWQAIEDSGAIGLHQASRSVEHRLGEPLSHGCVRLGYFTARWAYFWLPVGAPVTIR